MGKIKKSVFKKQDNAPDIIKYTITTSKNASLSVLNYGGIICSLILPDKFGNLDDIVLGYDTYEDYINNSGYFGALIGRFANRIKGASFALNGNKYNLYKNNGTSHLHGGRHGFDKKIYDVVKLKGNSIEMTLTSPDMDEGYPGNLKLSVSYTFDDDLSLKISYRATCDQDTIVNLTNHSYFNLNGHGNGNILNHSLKIDSDSITEIQEDMSFTGNILPIKNTPLDFSEFKKIGEDIDKPNPQIKIAGGYDFNYILNKSYLENKSVEVVSEKTGRKMAIYTDNPCVQLYTPNFSSNIKGKQDRVYKNRGAFCLESQGYPYSLSNKNFISPVLKKGEVYNKQTVYKFEII